MVYFKRSRSPHPPQPPQPPQPQSPQPHPLHPTITKKELFELNSSILLLPVKKRTFIKWYSFTPIETVQSKLKKYGTAELKALFLNILRKQKGLPALPPEQHFNVNYFIIVNVVLGTIVYFCT